MLFQRKHNFWKVALVVLLAFGSLPRFGCVCADGTHFACCKKIAHGITSQICRLFHDENVSTGCPCCAAKRQEDLANRSEQEVPGDPCKCLIQLEGPNWIPAGSFDLPTDMMVTAIPFVTLPLPPSMIGEGAFFATDVGPPIPPQLATVSRLNV